MPLTKFEICSSALFSMGADEIADFDGGTTESRVAARFWQGTVDNWLTLHDWRFATTQDQLSRDGTVPDHRWDAMYAIPSTMLKLRGVFVGDYPIPYDRYENKIYCNANSDEDVFADFIYSIDCQYWPPYFVTLIEQALMKKFAFALAGKLDLQKMVDVDLDMQFKLSKHADARQQTTKALNLRGRGTLIEARRA